MPGHDSIILTAFTKKSAKKSIDSLGNGHFFR